MKFFLSIAALILYNTRVFQKQYGGNNRLRDKKLVKAAFNSVADACLRLPEYIHLAEELCSNEDFFDSLISLKNIIQVNIRVGQ